MKNKKLLIAILCIFVFDLPGAANRIRQNFDFDWQFRLGENGDFREVQLPHDWSVELDLMKSRRSEWLFAGWHRLVSQIFYDSGELQKSKS